MFIRQIMCWQAEDGELYRDRDMALKHSPGGKLVELWGDGGYECKDPEHGPECLGPGDVEHHIMPYLRKQSITRLMGMILMCCGDKLNGCRSCGCTHAAMILIEKLQKAL